MKRTQKVTSRGKSKRVVSKKAQVFRKSVGRKVVSAVPAGFRLDRQRSGLFVPISQSTVVPAGVAKKGFAEARRRIDDALDELSSSLDGFEVSEIELQVSFSADGKFLGFGVGGAFSMTLKLHPSSSAR